MRYATIDRYAGYVQYVCDADTPKEAAIATAVEIDGDRGFVAEPLPLGDTTDRGYEVYEVPTSWDCTDGQDAAQIAEAAAGHLVGIYWVQEGGDT